jgi:hypothetical protein
MTILPTESKKDAFVELTHPAKISGVLLTEFLKEFPYILSCDDPGKVFTSPSH